MAAPSQAQIDAQIASLHSDYLTAAGADLRFTMSSDPTLGAISYPCDRDSILSAIVDLQCAKLNHDVLPAGYARLASDGTLVPWSVADLEAFVRSYHGRGLPLRTRLEAAVAACRVAADVTSLQAVKL